MTDTKTEVGRDLDMRIQSLIAPWDEKRCRVCGWPVGIFPACTKDDCSMRPHPPKWASDPARYSTDPASSMEFQKEVLARPSVIAATISVDSEGTTVSIELEESPFWIRGDHHTTLEGAWALAGLAALEADCEHAGDQSKVQAAFMPQGGEKT